MWVGVDAFVLCCDGGVLVVTHFNKGRNPETSRTNPQVLTGGIGGPVWSRCLRFLGNVARPPHTLRWLHRSRLAVCKPACRQPCKRAKPSTLAGWITQTHTDTGNMYVRSGHMHLGLCGTRLARHAGSRGKHAVKSMGSDVQSWSRTQWGAHSGDACVACRQCDSRC